MAIRSCLVVRHVMFEDLGTLAPLLAARGFAVRTLDAGIEPISGAALTAADLVVICGAPIGVYDTDAYPFLRGEIEAIRQRLRQSRPILGICLGAQLIAAALDAAVRPCGAAEIGWAPVELTEAGRRSPLAALEGRPVLHWHGDGAALPAGAVRLAATAICDNQAFAVGDRVLGLQFHVELDPARIEQWLIGHAVELAKAGIGPGTLRADTARHGPAMAEFGARAIAAWLDGAGLP